MEPLSGQVVRRFRLIISAAIPYWYISTVLISGHCPKMYCNRTVFQWKHGFVLIWYLLSCTLRRISNLIDCPSYVEIFHYTRVHFLGISSFVNIVSRVPNRGSIRALWFDTFNSAGISENTCLSPAKKGTCFRFVCLSGTLFSQFVRETPPTVLITHKQNLYHLKAGCLECVMGCSFFRTPQNFGEIGLWKRSKITYSNFWRVTSQRLLGPGLRYPYLFGNRKYFFSKPKVTIFLFWVKCEKMHTLLDFSSKFCDKNRTDAYWYRGCSVLICDDFCTDMTLTEGGSTVDGPFSLFQFASSMPLTMVTTWNTHVSYTPSRAWNTGFCTLSRAWNTGFCTLSRAWNTGFCTLSLTCLFLPRSDHAHIRSCFKSAPIWQRPCSILFASAVFSLHFPPEYTRSVTFFSFSCFCTESMWRQHVMCRFVTEAAETETS